MRDEASHGAEVSLFGQFWPRYTARISARIIARTPIQTVSRRNPHYSTSVRRVTYAERKELSILDTTNASDAGVELCT